MNWSTGLFRLWLVGTTIWAGFILFFTVPEITNAFRRAYVPEGYAILVPIDCKLAKGAEGKDYKLEEQGPWIRYRANPNQKFCIVTEEQAREAMPELRDYSRADLAETLTAAQGNFTPYPRPWQLLLSSSGLLVLPPLVIFSLGAALLWALRGFSAR